MHKSAAVRLIVLGLSLAGALIGCHYEEVSGGFEPPPLDPFHERVEVCCGPLIWTGTEFATTSGRELARIDAGGDLVDVVELGDEGRRLVDLVHDGQSYGVLTRIGNNVSLDRVDPDAGVDSVELFPSASENVAAAFTGTEYAIRHDLTVSRFDLAGRPIDRVIVRVTPPLAGRLVWNGSSYYAAWPADGALYFLELTADGAPVGDPVRVIDGELELQELLWSGSELVAIVVEGDVTLLARIDGGGQPILVADIGRFSTVAAVDGGYALASGEVLALHDANLERLDSRRVGSGREIDVRALAWNGERLGVIYSAIDADDSRHTMFQLVDIEP